MNPWGSETAARVADGRGRCDRWPVRQHPSALRAAVGAVLAAAAIIAAGCGGGSSGPALDPPVHGATQAELQKLEGIERLPGATFRFAVTGDQHLGYSYFGRCIVPLANRAGADFLMLIGDMTNTGLQEEYHALFGALTPVQIPVLTIPGNHEYKTAGGQVYQDIFKSSDYYFDHGGWRFVCLNNAQGALAANQLAWLSDTLKAGPGRAIVFVHVPPAGVDPNWAEARYYDGHYWRTVFDEGATEFRDICAANHVAAVYAGHIHAFDAAQDRGTLYILTGGGGGFTSQFAAEAPGNFCHITVVEVDEEGIRSQTVHVPGFQYSSSGAIVRKGAERSFVVDVATWETNVGQ